jgi:hypothetical protein
VSDLVADLAKHRTFLGKDVESAGRKGSNMENYVATALRASAKADALTRNAHGKGSDEHFEAADWHMMAWDALRRIAGIRRSTLARHAFMAELHDLTAMRLAA